MVLPTKKVTSDMAHQDGFKQANKQNVDELLKSYHDDLATIIFWLCRSPPEKTSKSSPDEVKPVRAITMKVMS
jgi:hypothetical protein